MGILALFGSALRGAAASGFSLLDRRLLSSIAVIGGVVPGVFALVCLRCVLGFCSRTRGLVGFVEVVMIGACVVVFATSSPSVFSFSPSVVGSGPPLTMISMAFFDFLNCFFCLFLSRWTLSIHSFVTLLVYSLSDNVGIRQCCGNKS